MHIENFLYDLFAAALYTLCTSFLQVNNFPCESFTRELLHKSELLETSCYSSVMILREAVV
jgi:hypothetical protein